MNINQHSMMMMNMMMIVEMQKYHILFTFHIPFITLFLSYPSIKPLISTIFMNKYVLPCYFPNHLVFSSLSDFVVNN